MGRRERPLNPAEGPVACFAYELRKLRQEAGGITYRLLARRAHYSVATLSQAAAGDRLPSLAVALAYAGACGGDLDEWRRRWHQAEREAAEHVRVELDEAEPPYPGLARFEADDHERFFGRDALVDQLADLVDGEKLVVVTGPSGSGKSSLLRAGLIPSLQQAAPGTRPAAIRILTPGRQPARTYADVLDPKAMRPGTVILVDQFEEIFTLCSDRAERTCFIDLLCAATESGHGVRVVVAVRADFYGHLTQHRELAEAARTATLLVVPMTQAELREAIVKPATLGGLVVERTLTARLVREVADEPGGLPLLSHALLETWRRRKGKVLTEAAYDAAGGLHGAIAHSAENLYGSLSGDEAEAARRILLRLVTPGQGNQDTRRPAQRAEITALGPGTSAEVRDVLERLARSRLVTLDGETVDVAHEAVLSAWPRLRGWIDEDRERLRVQRQLTEAAHNWEALGQEDGSLYRGVQLATAEQYWGADSGRGDLTALERRFLTASLADRTQTRRTRRARTAALSVLLVLSLVAGLAAWEQNRAGAARRTEADARRIAGVADSVRTSDPQAAMQLSLAAWRMADLPETRSALSAAAAQQEQDVFTDPNGGPRTMRRLSPDGRALLSVGTERTIRWDLTTGRRTATMAGLGKAWDVVGFPRADTRWLPRFSGPLVGGAGVAVHDLATGRTTGPALTDADAGAEMSPSGRTLIAYDSDGRDQSIQVWNPRTRRILLEVAYEKKTPAADILGISWTHQFALIAELMQERRGPFSDDASLPDATLSANDRFLAVCIPGEQLQLWDVIHRRQMPAPRLPEVSAEQCLKEQVTFSPDGSRVAVLDGAGLRTWQTETGHELPAVEYPGLLIAEFNQDSDFVAASDGKEILVWRLDAPDFPVFRHRLSGETVKDFALDTDAGILRYLGGPDDTWGPTVHTLTLGRTADPGWSPRANFQTLFSPDGETLAVASPDADGDHIRFRLFDGRTGDPLAEPRRMPCRVPDRKPSTYLLHCPVLMAFDSTGRNLAYGLGDMGDGESEHLEGQLALYDIARREITTTLTPDEIEGGPSRTVTYSPDDTSLLLTEVHSLNTPTKTSVWDLRRRTITRTIPDTAGQAVPHPDGRLFATTQGRAFRFPSGELLPPSRAPSNAETLAFSPDGELLAAGDTSGRVVLWDGNLERRLGVLTDPDTTTDQVVSALAFAPDSKTLAVAGGEGTLQLWDTTTRQRIGTRLPTPGDKITSLSFSPDGTTLHAAGAQSALQAYDIAPDTAARTICDRVTDPLTPTEWRHHLPNTPFRPACPGNRW